MGQLRSKSGTGKHFVYIPGNGAKRQLISVRVDVHYQGTGVYRSPERVFIFAEALTRDTAPSYSATLQEFPESYTRAHIGHTQL